MLTAGIENTLNRGLPRSPRAQTLCAELAGRKVRIEITDVAGLELESTGHSLKLGAPDAASAALTPDATIEGGPLSLLRLLGSAPEERFQRGDVRITGDSEIADRFRELAMLLRPDLEEELSLVVGDVAAHRIGRFARAAIDWTRRAAGTSVRNAAEYLAHEKRDLVPRSEAEQFLSGVETLREDVDRIAARIDLLTP